MQASPPRRSPTQAKPRRSRSVRLSVRPNGAIYGYIVEITNVTPRRERVVQWLGKSPSLETIVAACKRHGARVPNQIKETI